MATAASPAASLPMSKDIPKNARHSLTHSVVDREEAKRIERMALAVSSHTPPAIAQYMQKAAPAIGVIVAGLETAAPHVVKAVQKAYELYGKLPKQLAMSLWGFCICFFGGRYAVSIAAIEAFHTTGGKQMWNYIYELEEEVLALWEENKKDDKEDLDGDGIADVDEITPNQLAMRKLKMFLRTTDPERFNKALSGLWSGYMGVLVALRFQFAKTVALANSIADNIRPVAGKILLPGLLHVTPEEYRGWIRLGLKLSCKTFALLVAWRIQMIISSVQSGIKGGLILSQSLYMFLQEKNYFKAGLDDTYIDDAMSWTFAFMGIYYQLIKGGSLPFPLNLFMLPMAIMERVLQWQVTFVADRPMVADK